MSKETQINLPEIKQSHGGKRPGAGRPKGTTKKEPTKAIRVPVSLIPEVQTLIEAHKSAPQELPKA